MDDSGDTAYFLFPVLLIGWACITGRWDATKDDFIAFLFLFICSEAFIFFSMCRQISLSSAFVLLLEVHLTVNERHLIKTESLFMCWFYSCAVFYF